MKPPNARRKEPANLAAFDLDAGAAKSAHGSGAHRLGTFAHGARELRVGAEFAGRYRIERHIATGGMGSVWEAEDLLPTEAGQARVALKILTALGDLRDDARERFRRETALASGLVGEQFASVLGHGIEEGVPYIALELFEGETLHDRLKGRALSPVESLALLRQAAEGLDIAHSFGIVHRDISPKNLFLARSSPGTDKLKILDFGIAKHALFDARLTEPGTLMGSLQYMSPEQVRSASAADATSDLWSLAVVLYRCLLGRHPFAGERGELLVSIATQPHTLPSSIAPELGSAVDDFFAVALAKDCRQRYRTGEAMATAFEDAVRGLESPVGPVSVRPSFPGAGATVLARASYADFAGKVSRMTSDAPTADGVPSPGSSGALALPSPQPEAVAPEPQPESTEVAPFASPQAPRRWLILALIGTLILAVSSIAASGIFTGP